MPGLTVVDTQDGVCVQLNRSRGRSGCNYPELYVDGVRVPDVPGFLDLLPPSSIARFEILTSLEAGSMYGADTGFGVLLIETRSGPLESERRPPRDGVR